MHQTLMSFPYHHPHDQAMLVEVLQQSRTKQEVPDYPAQVDLEEMLQLPEVQQRAKLWTTQGGLPIGFTLIDQYNNLIMEFVPGFLNTILGEQIVQWGIQCMQKVGLNKPGEISLDGVCREDETVKVAIYEKNGFVKQSFSTIKFERDMKQHFPEPQLPPNMTIRPINGKEEIPAIVSLHQAAFNTNIMTETERLAIMSTSDYDPRLDLVIQLNDGKLAGYCTCMINRLENETTGRLVGYTDPIAVRPAYQKKGLGTALVLTGLRLLKQRGMEIVSFGTSSDNIGMIKLAQKLGFKETQRKVWYSKSVPPIEQFQPRGPAQ